MSTPSTTRLFNSSHRPSTLQHPTQAEEIPPLDGPDRAESERRGPIHVDTDELHQQVDCERSTPENHQVAPVFDEPNHTPLAAHEIHRISLQMDLAEGTMLGESDYLVTGVRQVMRKLRTMQSKLGRGTKFHLLLEETEGQKRPRQQLPSGENSTTKLNVRVLFSPSLFLDQPAGGESADMLVDSLVGFYIQSQKDARERPQPPATQFTQPVQQAIPDSSFHEEPQIEHEYSQPNLPGAARAGSPHNGPWNPPHLYVPQLHTNTPNVRPTVEVPRWFPGRPYTTGLQTGGTLDIDSDTVRIFEQKERALLSWFYGEVFKTLHNICKSKLPKELSRRKFSIFTPPWIRRTLRIPGKNLSSEMINAVIPDRKSNSGPLGHRRLSYILAAFYKYENEFVKPVIDYVLRNETTLYHQYMRGANSRKDTVDLEESATDGT